MERRRRRALLRVVCRREKSFTPEAFVSRTLRERRQRRDQITRLLLWGNPSWKINIWYLTSVAVCAHRDKVPFKLILPPRRAAESGWVSKSGGGSDSCSSQLKIGLKKRTTQPRRLNLSSLLTPLNPRPWRSASVLSSISTRVLGKGHAGLHVQLLSHGSTPFSKCQCRHWPRTLTHTHTHTHKRTCARRLTPALI